MKGTLGQQRPISDADVRPAHVYDRVGANPLEDRARESLALLTENAVRGVVGEYVAPAHAACPRCGCPGIQP